MTDSILEVCLIRKSIKRSIPNSTIDVCKTAWTDYFAEKSTFATLTPNGNGVLEPGASVGVNITPADSASFSPPISSADFDHETLDMELGARLEALGLPAGLEAELVKAVTAL